MPPIIGSKMNSQDWGTVNPFTYGDAGFVGRNGGGGGYSGPAAPQAGSSNNGLGNLLAQRLNYGYDNGMANLAPAPRIDSGPIWNPQQINQRVNAMRASNDMSAATSTRNMQANTSAKGFGSNSPLSQALAAQFSGQAMGANTAGENDLRWNAASGNAQHLFDTQMGRNTQWNQANQQAIDNKRLQMQNRQSSLSMLASLM